MTATLRPLFPMPKINPGKIKGVKKNQYKQKQKFTAKEALRDTESLLRGQKGPGPGVETGL